MPGRAENIISTTAGLTLDVAINLPRGLHSRPSAKLAQAARQFEAEIRLLTADGEVDAKSMLDILSLALQRNDQVRILARGPQAREALLALAAILEGDD